MFGLTTNQCATHQFWHHPEQISDLNKSSHTMNHDQVLPLDTAGSHR
jgi:hypothetical protein